MAIWTRVWKEHRGKIPKDAEGRSYEIHHLNGDRTDNRIENLVCLSIEEHYAIHYEQGDWNACNAILTRMEVSAEEKSEIASLAAKQRLERGTHNFSSDHSKKVQANLLAEGRHVFQRPNYHKDNAKKMLEKGTHNFLGGKIQKRTNAKRVEEGTHNFLGERNPSHKRVEEGTHNFLDKEAARERALDQNSREIVVEVRSLSKKHKIKLGSGWTRRSTEFLELLKEEIVDKYGF